LTASAGTGGLGSGRGSGSRAPIVTGAAGSVAGAGCGGGSSDATTILPVVACCGADLATAGTAGAGFGGDGGTNATVFAAGGGAELTGPNWNPAITGFACALSASVCHGTLARATSCGFLLMAENVSSSSRTISVSRRRAVAPPITTPMT